MAKRRAEYELNPDNWNEEEAPEEAGTFCRAASDVMQHRVMRSGKLKCVDRTENNNAAKNPYGALGDFKATSNNSVSTVSPWSFLTNMSKPSDTSNGSASKNVKTDSTDVTSDSKSTEYYSNLKGLNQCVSRWIKSHVDSNPLCILTPIFKDYERYLTEIDEKESKQQLGKEADVTQRREKSPEKSPTTEVIMTECSQPFTSSNVTKSDIKPDKSMEGEDDDQPPKVEFTPVNEEGAIYSKRCKVFVKKEASFQERGVGMLYLKPAGEKTQLIVRADTNLGNLLVNTLLMASLPVQRMGSNNVMLVCVPTPNTKPPPVPILLRLKTGDDADEVFSKLKEYMK